MKCPNMGRSHHPTGEAAKEYYKDQHNKRIGYQRIAQRKFRKKYKNLVFNHYGWRCVCPNCPETNPAFLTIDHKNNDACKDRIKGGGKRQGGNGMYSRIIKLGFPDTFQTLCMNCNWGKRFNNGICPHERNKVKKKDKNPPGKGRNSI